MKKSLKKMFKALVALNLVICIAVLFIPNKKQVFAATSKVYYLTVSVGETYETAGVNYHCDEDNSYVMYGSSLSAMQKAETTSTLWSVEQNSDDENTGFSPRYVCKAKLENLLPDTTYYYYVVVGSEQSDTRTFKTGKASGSTSVLFLTDTQSASTSQFQKINPLVEAIEAKEKNLNMVLMTGDIVDRGGYSAQWDAYFNGLTALEGYQYATLPGNHEYYHDSDPAYIDSSFYDQFFNNPQNGPEDRLNTSYYFVYGETLYIMLDVLPNTKYPYDLEAHQAWFKQVVADNPTRWIVVGSHAGAITAGIYAHDANVVWANWHEVFEECQVDLAISGHEHIYIRKDLYYQGEKNEELGVTYLVGPAAGPKDYPIQNTDGLDVAKRGNYRGNVIKTQGSTMTVTLYDTTGTVIESFTLSAKRNAEPMEITDEEILNSVSYEYDEPSSKLNILWSTDIWGVVKEVKCSGNSTWSQLIPSCAEAFAHHTINGVYNTYNYKYTITFVKTDGTEISKELNVLLNPDLLPSSITITGNNKLAVDETSQLSVVLGPEGCDQSVTFESLNPEIATVDEFGLVTAISAGRARIKVVSTIKPTLSKVYTITVEATTAPESITVTGLPDKYELDQQYSYTILATPNSADKSVTWESSDIGVAQVANNKIYVLGYGTATITATSKLDPTISYSFVVTCNKDVTEITIESSKTTIDVNEELKLNVTINPSDAPQDVTYVSSNSEVATVEQGVVKGLKAGTTTITVTSINNPEKSASITITVQAPIIVEPTPKKGCNCKKDLTMALTLTALLLGCVLVIRKKH